MSKPLETRKGKGTKSRRSSPDLKSKKPQWRVGPRCSRCEGQLVKKDNLEGRYYECPRHGFIRDIIPVYQYIERTV